MKSLYNGTLYDINTAVYMVHDCGKCIPDDNLVEWKRIHPHTLLLSNAADTNLKLKTEPLIFPIKTEWGLAIEI